MDDSSDITGFRFVDISMLTEVFQMLLCPECKAGNISIEEESMKMGFASTITVACEKEKCNFSASFCTSSKVGHSYEVNRRALLAARNIGVGHQGLTKFAAVMNMPQPMSKNAYRNATKTVHKAAKEIVTKSMSEAASQTKEFYDEDEDGHIDIGVSGDGTWRKRGFKSSTGVVSVMSIVTGKVLDVEVMSKECRACLLNTRKEGSQKYKDWWDSHKSVCHINFSGSSGRMDASGCLEMFQRSEEKHSLRYTEFLGDGDSKAHKQLLEKKVYGDKPVTKLECVGHIQKRMGSHLRSLKKRCGKEPLGDGKSIGGKGRLTDKLIDSLQVYYGKAIRSNLHSIEEMEKAIMAIWHHICSTDDSPQHHLCPKGTDSWCGFQRDVANKTNLYQHDHPLPVAVAEKIKDVFHALSEESLLSACLHGGTQNQNESFNGLIWQRAPKVMHSGLPTVELATYLAVGIFNDGSGTLLSILEELGIQPGVHCVRACKKLDRERLYHLVYKNSDRAKKRRRAIRNKKKGFAEALEVAEGLQYEAGAF